MSNKTISIDKEDLRELNARTQVLRGLSIELQYKQPKFYHRLILHLSRCDMILAKYRRYL